MECDVHISISSEREKKSLIESMKRLFRKKIMDLIDGRRVEFEGGPITNEIHQENPIIFKCFNMMLF